MVSASTVPMKRSMSWAAVMAVLAMITEATLSSFEASSLTSQAFTGSPPTPPSMVTAFTASPAERAASSRKNGTRARENAQRQPRVSSAWETP